MSSRKLQPVPIKQAIPLVHKSGLHMTAQVRDVTQVPQIEDNHTLVAYKDLNEGAYLQSRRQKQQMLFAFSFFLLLGLLMLTGQMIQKPRMIASTQVDFKVAETPNQVEHYQFDKSCYKGENGEKVCLTRTSEKK